MNLPELSIRRPVFAWMLMFGLILLGSIAYQRLGVSYMPDVDFPVLDIRVQWEGAAPEVIETEIIDEIEQEVIQVDGLKEMRSSISQGSANITLEFTLDTNVDAALQEVQGALSQINLPLNVEPPSIRKSNPEDDPIMWIGVSSTRPLRELAKYVELTLLDEFQVLEGVGEVILGGFTERNLRIWVKREELEKRELTVMDIVQAIETEHRELASGYIENENQEINVRTMGEALTVEQMENLLITRRGGQPIYDSNIRLRDVARIEDGLADIRRIVRVNGVPAVGIGIKKQRGSNEVDVGERVKTKLAQIQANLPPDIQMGINVDFTQGTVNAVKNTEHELLIAALLTSLICYLFLGTFRASFNVILAIPTSIIGSFLALYFLNFTLNLFTLLALALAIGIVVDDAIMMLENIVRHQDMGKNRIQAALDGSKEIIFAALAATLAVIAIFLPVAFMDGIIGKFFYQFGVAICIAVALSLLEALTLTPMRCSQFMQAHGQTGKLGKTMERIMESASIAYRKLLELALRHRIKVLSLSLLIFLLSLLLVRTIPSEFVPAQDLNYIRMNIRAEPGTSLTAMDEISKQVEQYMMSRKDIIERVFLSVGGFGGSPNTAFLNLALKPKDERTLGHLEIMKQIRADLSHLKGVRIQLSDISTRGLTTRRSFPVAFNLRGPDYDTLKQSADQIISHLEQKGIVTDLDTDYQNNQPELRILPMREEAAIRGISMQEIGQTINAAIGGIRQGNYTADGRRYDVRIRLEPDERTRPEDIPNLNVRTAFGEIVPLFDVVEYQQVQTVQSISRINRQRSISITGNLPPGQSQADVLNEIKRIGAQVLPENYTLSFEGGSQAFQESFSSLWLALALGILVAYMVLASQFNSFLHPVLILLALPFSLSGALIALAWAGASINLFSFIGLLLLMGIVKKNSILLVEFTNQIRERGTTPHLALLQACPIRLRPILMTSASTMGAALPLAISTGYGSEARSSMGLAILGGVLISTLFTLLVVPCAYSITSTWQKQPEVSSSES